MKQSLEPSLKVQMDLDQHEAECAIRYEMVNKTLEQLDKRLWRLEAITIASNSSSLEFSHSISDEQICERVIGL